MIVNYPRKHVRKVIQEKKKVCSFIKHEWNTFSTQIFPQRKLEVLTDGFTGRVYQTSWKLNSHGTQSMEESPSTLHFPTWPYGNNSRETAGRCFPSPKQASYPKELQHLSSLGVSHGPGGHKANQCACEWAKDCWVWLRACAEHPSGSVWWRERAQTLQHIESRNLETPEGLVGLSS